MCLDVITGVIAGYKQGVLSSSIGAKGLVKKAGVFVCISFAYLLDLAMNINMFRGMIISGFAIMEAMSLIENIDHMGYGYLIPDFLRNHMTQIAGEKHIEIKGEDKHDSGH